MNRSAPPFGRTNLEETTMKLYFSPLACSMASRIAFYESRAEVDYLEVDTRAKRVADGRDFLQVNPLGMVPVLETDEGELFTENAAILQLIAERHPHARLAPRDPLGRARLQQLLSFIGTELHKATYLPLLDKAAPAAMKEHARAGAGLRLAWMAARLEGRDQLLDELSVADTYLFTVLNWSSVTHVDLEPWPALLAFTQRMRARPSVVRALEEETALYARRSR
jgi:glutathione S-transferase